MLSLETTPLAALVALAAGLGAGAAHALLGPDHLAAVAPLSLGRGRGAVRVGFRWGVGHALGALLLGVIAVTARDALPWQGLSVWAERAVGALLVGLGLWTVRRATATVLHAHSHTHDLVPARRGESASPSVEGVPHAHVHLHSPGAGHPPATSQAATANPLHRHGHAALGIGLLHGFAGFGHLWAALPALALPRTEATLYLVAYGSGTLAAMGLFASLLGRVSAASAASGSRLLRRAMTASGLLAIGVGVWWMASGGI